MKKIIILLILCVGLSMAPVQQSHAQIGIIKEILIKIIKAIDLAVQKVQNKTIWLQNAQKALENTMSKLKLDEISGWVEKQRTLYKDYFEELQKVKNIIAYYQRIKDLTQKNILLVDAYKKAFALFKQDQHFTSAEIAYMEKVYSGILEQSAKNIDQIFIVINSFSTQMSDAKRLEIIDGAAEQVDKNYADLVQFNTQNKLLSLHRAKDQQDIDVVRALYGIK
ncbi:MAG: conjugal transfer protein TraI [Bacteroidetes bacterium]|nr:conjugal transfer protein TraI [Bacteroidota bacterium]